MAKNNKILLYRTNILGSTTEKIESGELAMNYNSNSPFLMFKDNNGSIQKLGALKDVSGSSTYHTMSQKAVTEQVTMPSDYNVTYPNVNGITLTNTLANSHTKTAIKNIDTNLTLIAQKLINSENSSNSQTDDLIDAIGLNDDLSYKQDTSSNYLSDVNSLTEADSKLDDILGTVSGDVVTLRNDLTTETNNRISADNTLQSNINAEQEARTEAINNLQTSFENSLNDEITARKNADTALESTLQTSINSEIQRATDAENVLQENIKAEENERISADNVLQSNLDAEKRQRTESDATLTNNLNTEIATRKAIEGQSGSTYTKNNTTSYISNATSLNNADVLLDEAISNLKMTAVIGSELSGLGTNVKEAYKLIDGNSTQHGNYIKIYKDTSLKSVSFSDQQLHFTYILTDGSEDVVDVDVSAFLTENEYGDGLQVIDHVISAKLGEDTETNKNFLDLEDNGGTTKALAVRSVDTDRTYTTEEITVMGGPLAKLLTDVGINKINAGTDIQSLLMTLLCKEIYPYNSTSDSWYMADEASLGNQKKVAYSTPNFSNSIAAPTINGFSTGTVEAGTKFTYTVTTPATSTARTASTVSNLTWGYSATDDDKADSTDTSITKEWTKGIGTDSYTLKTTVNSGFGGISIADVTGTNASRPTYSQSVQVADGTNKITWNITGCSYTATVVENSSVYMVSNLGKTDANIKTNVISAKTVTCNAPTSSTNKSVTGARFSFAGAKQATTGITNAMELTSANIRALKSNGTSTTFSITFPDKTSHVYIALPPGKTLTKVEDTGAFGTDIVASFKANTKTNISVEGANGYTAKAYTVYIYAPDALLGANTYNVTIS